MSLDPLLIDTIKAHFARKSSAQLQEIVQSKDQVRWSAEAVAAAGEVLEDRRAGRAQEPEVPEEERPPLSSPDPSSFSLGLMVHGLMYISPLAAAAFLAISRYADRDRAENISARDLPIPFGPKMAWLALDTTETEAVANALGLRETRPATWAEGIAAAERGSVFITPPLADWTLAVGRIFCPPDRAETFVKPLLERLSGQFRDAQYYCTFRDVELHIWARAWQGRLVRGYGWLGDKNLTLWNEGAPTKEERDLGFRFVDRRFSPAAQGQVGADEAPTAPDENCVTQLALLWSIDPTILNEQFMEPAHGLLGSVHGADPGRAP